MRNNQHLIIDRNGDDFWVDEKGIVWVRQSELVEAVKLATKNAMSAAVASLTIPEELCGKKGARFDGAPPTGACSLLTDHEGKHSWEK